MEGIQFDIYLDANMNGDKPKDGAKPYVSIKTNSEGYATTEDDAYPHGRLPYGHYTIIENASTVPTGFAAIRNLHVDGTKTGGVYDGQLIQTGIYADLHGAWIQLAKIDADSLKQVPRAGAEFKILKSDRNTVHQEKDLRRAPESMSRTGRQKQRTSIPSAMSWTSALKRKRKSFKTEQSPGFQNGSGVWSYLF